MAPDQYAVSEANLPIQRPNATGKKAVIMEILRVDWYQCLEDGAQGTLTTWSYLTTNTQRQTGETASDLEMANDAADPRTFANAGDFRLLQTSGAIDRRMPHSVDMTDGAGNGYLFAADTLTMVSMNRGSVQTSSVIAKILYRWVEVGLIEYLGIVQSQQ